MAEEIDLDTNEPEVGSTLITDNPNQPIIYTNMCGVQFGPEDVLLQFAIRDTSERNNGYAVGRVYSNMSNMKRLIFILNKSLKEFEDLFGEIPMDVMERITPEGKRRMQEQQEKKDNELRDTHNGN